MAADKENDKSTVTTLTPLLVLRRSKPHGLTNNPIVGSHCGAAIHRSLRNTERDIFEEDF